MAKYGIPYQGSKGTIAKEICKIFPNAENFYDLFGGGFSIMHCMLETRTSDFKKFHFNEIRPGVCELVVRAIIGEYNYKIFKPKWVSREDFFAKKDSNPYIKLFWSFGNDGRSYLFGKKIESYKKSLHNAVVSNEFDEVAINALGIYKFEEGLSIKERRLMVRQLVKSLNPEVPRDVLEQLQSLQQLEQIEHIAFYETSYEKVPILDNSIIYCDIPYMNTKDYDKNNTFDRGAFLDWAHAQKEPVFISEYEILDPRFKEVFSIKKRSLMAAGNKRIIKVERVYANEAAFMLINKET